jgi:hypothetical protein
VSAGGEEFCVPVLRDAGFMLIGDLSYRQYVQLWWHRTHCMEVILYPGSPVLAKGTKAFYLTAISPQGELYARDLSNLHDFLQSTFPEIHISFTHHRDLSDALSTRRIMQKLAAWRGKNAVAAPAAQEAELSRMAAGFEAKKDELRRAESLRELNGGRSPLIQSYLNRTSGDLKRELGEMGQRARKLEGELAEAKYLLREYRKKGSAACMLFSFSSNLQVATDAASFRPVVEHIVREVTDAARYQIVQKLNGSRLQVYVEEARDPVLFWQIEWAGGRLSPCQLERLGPPFRELAARMDEATMVTPTEDISVGGAVKDEKKRVGARPPARDRRAHQPHRGRREAGDHQQAEDWGVGRGTGAQGARPDQSPQQAGEPARHHADQPFRDGLKGGPNADA